MMQLPIVFVLCFPFSSSDEAQSLCPFLEMPSQFFPPGMMEVEAVEFDDEFSVMVQNCKVPESIQQILIEKQYTSSALFAFAFTNDSALEDFILLLGTLHDDPPNWSSSVEASSIRHLHHCCLQSVKRSERPTTPAVSNSAHHENSSGMMGSLLDLAWADLPPVRVKEVDFIAMKKEFNSKYPSESLSFSNTPCARLTASLMQQKTRKAFSWIPWKELLSESRWLDIQEKGRKRQKLEGIILYDAVADVDEDELSGAPFFIQSILETRAIALALTKICHLSVGKKYLTNFMKLYTAKSADSGLRPPSLREAQSADKEFWSEAFNLVNEDPDTWTVESAVTEVLEVKNLLSVLMMQRPRTMKGKGKGKGSGKKGKEKGKGKSQWDKSPYAKKTWQSNWGKSTSDGGQFCYRFHLYNTCTSSNCKFSHTCPVLVNGKPCGQKHRATEHGRAKN